MLETQKELDFVKQLQRDVSDNRTYRIAGDTCVDPPAFIDFTDYTPEGGCEFHSTFNQHCESILTFHNKSKAIIIP